jgi:membrane protein YdbS with pleckstrin-like domain
VPGIRDRNDDEGAGDADCGSVAAGYSVSMAALAREAPWAAEAEWRRPSGRFLLMRRVEVAALTVAVAATAGGLVAPAAGWWGAVAAAATLLAGLAAEWFVRRRVCAWAYCEREDDLLVRRGVLFSRLSVIPYGRMQFVDVRAGPVERAFGLATVRMHTAAAASDARIPGLSGEEAARLRDRLAELGEALAAGL